MSEQWRCEQCGETFDEAQPYGHTRSEHSPRCDGYKCAPDCPIPVLCGPVVPAAGADAEGKE